MCVCTCVCVFYGLTDMLGCFGQTNHVLTSVPNGFRMVIYWDFFGGLVKSKTVLILVVS